MFWERILVNNYSKVNKLKQQMSKQIVDFLVIDANI